MIKCQIKIKWRNFIEINWKRHFIGINLKRHFINFIIENSGLKSVPWFWIRTYNVSKKHYDKLSIDTLSKKSRNILRKKFNFSFYRNNVANWLIATLFLIKCKIQFLAGKMFATFFRIMCQLITCYIIWKLTFFSKYGNYIFFEIWSIFFHISEKI